VLLLLLSLLLLILPGSSSSSSSTAATAVNRRSRTSCSASAVRVPAVAGAFLVPRYYYYRSRRPFASAALSTSGTTAAVGTCATTAVGRTSRDDDNGGGAVLAKTTTEDARTGVVETAASASTRSDGRTSSSPRGRRRPKSQRVVVADVGAKKNKNKKNDDEFLVAVLGDLHLDPRDVRDVEVGRRHWTTIFREYNRYRRRRQQQRQQRNDDDETREEEEENGNLAIVSLGDLGESKPIVFADGRNGGVPFSGTTACHEMAAEYLRSFRSGDDDGDVVPYEVVAGNHDLEAIDEFDTDETNMDAFLKAHGKLTPQFVREVADKTLLVGLSATKFRSAQFTSHEVTVSPEQLEWFEETLRRHPAEEGWKVFVFSHAPPIGSGLRVLEENHVANGCCWLNHSDEQGRGAFVDLVRRHRCVKAWFSGHFHLGQDYEDSIALPAVVASSSPKSDNPCSRALFVETSVMRAATSRDGRQQSRLLRGDGDGFEICTVDHKDGGKVRVDAAVAYSNEEDGSSNDKVVVYAHNSNNDDDAVPLHKDFRHDDFLKAYSPRAGDAYHEPDDKLIRYKDSFVSDKVDEGTIAWWYLASGRVLGILNGMLLEYDRTTLAPVGMVVGPDELLGKRVAVIDSGGNGGDNDGGGATGSRRRRYASTERGMEGYECGIETSEQREQAVLLLDDEDARVVVVQPNEDGSYWRRIVRNKLHRMKEARRERAAREFVLSDANARRIFFGADRKLKKPQIISTWGPYTTTVGHAVKAKGITGLLARLRREEDAAVVEGATAAASTAPSPAVRTLETLPKLDGEEAVAPATTAALPKQLLDALVEDAKRFASTTARLLGHAAARARRRAKALASQFHHRSDDERRHRRSQ